MVQTLKFSEMVAGGDIGTDDKTPGLEAGANVLYNNPWTFLAEGSTGARPIPAADMYYRLRLNTTLEVYEYYDPTTLTWTQLSGSGTGTVNPGVANDMAFYAANGTALSAVASSPNAVLVTNGVGTGQPLLSTTLPSGLSIPGAIITLSTAGLLSGTVVAAPVAGNDITNKTYVDALVAGSVLSITGTANQIIASSPTGNVVLSLPQDIALGSTPTFGGLTLTSAPLGGSSGGTGINNGSNTLTLSGHLETAGAFSSVFTMTGSTNLTFPTSGLLLTSAGAVTSLIATANQTTVNAATGAVTVGIASNSILPGTGGVTLPSGNTAARAGGAGTMRFNSQSLVFESTFDGATWATIDTSTSGDVDSITGTANQIIASSPTGNVVLSLPQSIATTSAVQFSSIRLSNLGILDANNVTMMTLGSTASAVNFFGMSNAATTSQPSLLALGSDANIIMIIGGKGTGGTNVIGTGTNDNAPVRSSGELLSSSYVTGVGLTTSVISNVTSLPLTAGDWDVWGFVSYNYGAGCSSTRTIHALNSASATISAPTDAATIGNNTAPYASSGAASSVRSQTGVIRLSLAATTTYYLNVTCVFAGGTLTAEGMILARRRR